jgi:hypothetical protein
MKYLLLLVLSIAFYAKGDVCVKYSSNDFFLKKTIYKNGKEIIKNKKVDYIKIYFFKNRSTVKPITLEYSLNSKKRYYRYIFCGKEGNKEICSIECDGGGFYINKNFDINIWYPLRVFSKEGAINYDYEIVPKRRGYIKGVKFKCPKVMPKAKNKDNNINIDERSGKYVCYLYKSDSKYYGCFRSIKSCKSLHRQYFGKYATTKDSKLALDRCKSSTPNKDFVDNPKGRYVCYEYKDKYGEYNGCFRSIKSCKSLHKKHFGHYLNRAETKSALNRCIDSMPRR